MRRKDVRDVANLANEVSRMALDLMMKIDAHDDDVMVSRAHSVKIAALKRRSMDLTRALARLRNPWRAEK